MCKWRRDTLLSERKCVTEQRTAPLDSLETYGQAEACTPLIPIHGKQRNMDLCEFLVSQGNTGEPSLKRKEGGREERREGKTEKEAKASLIYIASSHSETQDRESLIPLLHKCHPSVLSLPSRMYDGFQPSPALIAESLSYKPAPPSSGTQSNPGEFLH